mgnify:CR=1 FL=1
MLAQTTGGRGSHCKLRTTLGPWPLRLRDATKLVDGRGDSNSGDTDGPMFGD